MSQTTWVSGRELCKHLNLSESGVRKAVTLGRLTGPVDVPGQKFKMYDLELAKREYADNTKPEKQRTIRVGGAAAKKQDITPVTPEGVTMAEINKRKAQVDLATRQLKLRAMSNEMVDKNQAYNEFFELGKSLREDLERLPERVTDRIMEMAMSGDRTGIRNYLLEEIKQALIKITSAPSLDSAKINFQ